MAGAFVGALIVLALSTVFSWQIGGQPTMIERAFAAPQGACLSWKAADARDIVRVPCSAEHQFEVIGSVSAAQSTSEDPPMPQAAQWRELTEQKCGTEAQRYLGGELDPFGKFSVGALTPTQEQWDDGERSMRCGLQHAGVTGQALPVTGSATEADQSDVHEPGTCLGLTEEQGVGDPVDCDKRHAYEIVGNVDLGESFPDKYPSETAQSEKLSGLCNRELVKYAGSRKLPDGMVIYWDTLRQASWQSGSTRVDCKVAGELSKGANELQPVTGSVADAGDASDAEAGQGSAEPSRPQDTTPGNGESGR